MKSRKVPYALQHLIEAQLDDTIKRDVIEPINYSEWATPTVYIPKGEKEVGICGDYKLTVNPQLEVDQYTLPTANDLFTTLNGGRRSSQSWI